MSIIVEHLSKSYGKQRVLNDISFSIGTGEVVAFLGNNGAGKSTTMKIITGYVEADAGQVSVCGIDVRKNPLEANRRIGYLPEHNPIYPEMFVKEYLMFIAGVYGLGREATERVDLMIEKTGLVKEYKKKIGTLSKGYRQRVGLAQALIHDPDVMILDEPTTGLDPNQIVEVRDLIKEIGREKTVLLSTHIMQEVSAICDRVIIINNGRIAVDDSESRIVSHDSQSRHMIEIEFLNAADADFIKEIQGVIDVMQISPKRFVVEAETDLRERIFSSCASKNAVLITLKLQELSMEDVFRSVTSKK